MHDHNALRAALDGPFKPMTQYRQFMLWRIESNPETGKPTKVPYSIYGGKGSSTSSDKWCSAEDALIYANAWQMGIAFAFTDSDPFTFIDLDHCRVGNDWTDEAKAICAQFAGAAIEVSQSEEGLHIFTCGDVPAGYTGRIGSGVECYHSLKFVALTGLHATGNAAHNVGPVLNQFIESRFPKRQTVEGDLVWNSGPVAEAGNVPSNDNDLLRAFLSAPAYQPRPDAYHAFAHLTEGCDAVHVERVVVSNADLFNANIEVLAQAWPSDKDVFDRSQAAFALACRLAAWTGKDCDRMMRLMYKAAFQRTKADAFRLQSRNQTYMQFDVMRACLMATNVRKWNAADANDEVKRQGAQGYQAFYDRIAAAGDVLTIRAICEESGYDLSIDKVYREILAQHVCKCIALLGEKLPIGKCRDLVDIRSSHPTPDLRELTRQQNIAMCLPEDTVILAPVMSIAQMLDEFVFIADGSQVGSINNRHMSLSLPDFRNMLAASQTVGEGGTLKHTEAWLQHEARKMVTTRTFHAGGKIITRDPLEREALNMWRPIVRGEYIMDVSPFVDHVRYLFADDADKFLDWLAHIEQKPGELPHFGWLHIADNTGTGRGWLSFVIGALWGNYCAPSVDMDALVGGSFNGVLAGKLIAIVDEIRAGAREDAYMMEGKIRNMLTENVRYIKPKYGREYSEHNACRWLVCSNHRNAIPLSKNDRRWHVVHLNAAPRDPAIYAYLYELCKNPAFIQSIGAWLAVRDISRFRPGDRPEMNNAKRKAIDASTSDHQRIANNLVDRWPADFITQSDLTSCMYEGDMASMGKKLSPAMKHALQDAGMYAVDKQLYASRDERFRVWIVRNVDRWLSDLSIAAVGPELLKMRATMKGSGHQVLMDHL